MREDGVLEAFIHELWRRPRNANINVQMMRQFVSVLSVMIIPVRRHKGCCRTARTCLPGSLSSYIVLEGSFLLGVTPCCVTAYISRQLACTLYYREKGAKFRLHAGFQVKIRLLRLNENFHACALEGCGTPTPPPPPKCSNTYQ